MLCLRCRALPWRSPLTRLAQSTSQPQLNTSTTTSLRSRAFSSTLLSTPSRLLSPPQTQSTRLLVCRTPTPIQSPSSAVPSSMLLSSIQTQQQQQQTRQFSASASLSVKRQTFRPSRRVQKRRHGFLSRSKTRKGRLILSRRRSKGRTVLSW